MSFSAPGKPGNIPRWTTGAKVGVGTAYSADSNVWFTISHGIINEVYYPRIHIANIRDLGFIVTDGKEFFSEEKRHTEHSYSTLEDGVPAYRIINVCNKGNYKIEKRVITDPKRNVLMQEVTFTPLVGRLEDYHLYALLAPHIFNAGYGNNGWIGQYKGHEMLFAEHQGHILAFQANVPFKKMTCGYVGVSDAWQDLYQNKQLTRFYNHAKDGNIALCAEIDLLASKGKFVMVLAFANNIEEAGLQLRSSLFKDFDLEIQEYAAGWRNLKKQLIDLSTVDAQGGVLYRTSASVLKIHEGKHFSGGVIASLSIPWGATRSDHDLGGYHLVWPRDQVHTAQSLLAAGDRSGARHTLLFLMGTQELDGHWVQCMWEDGTPYWTGNQMDETSLPILLADSLRREHCLTGINPIEMVERAATFIAQNGPTTQQDRWEEVSGYTPYTLAVEIAALLAAADFVELAGKKNEAEFLRDTADWWNHNIEKWLFVNNTDLCHFHKVDGYYVRFTPFEKLMAEQPESKKITLKHLPEGQNIALYTEIVSPDALALVRFGLRKPDDPRILSTIKVIDAVLKTETKKGAAWHRFNRDGYGEHEDGTPFDGTGIGRAWPLLTGERAHYELAKGNINEAIRLLRVFANFAGVGGMLPEQVWDADDIPEKKLFNGESAGSAKPLVSAHAEYILLLRSLRDNKVYNMPPQTVERYLINKTKPKYAIWRFNHKFLKMPHGLKLRIIAHSDSIIRWTADGWQTIKNDQFKVNNLNIRYIDLPTDGLPWGTKIEFTFYWNEYNKWEGINYVVEIADTI